MDLTTLTSDRLALNGSDAPTTRRIVAWVYRLLARGRPVEPRHVAAYAAAPVTDAEKVLEDWGGTRRNGDGRVLAAGHVGRRVRSVDRDCLVAGLAAPLRR